MLCSRDLSSPTRDRTHVPWIEVQSLNHWTACKIHRHPSIFLWLWCDLLLFQNLSFQVLDTPIWAEKSQGEWRQLNLISHQVQMLPSHTLGKLNLAASPGTNVIAAPSPPTSPSGVWSQNCLMVTCRVFWIPSPYFSCNRVCQLYPRTKGKLSTLLAYFLVLAKTSMILSPHFNKA